MLNYIRAELYKAAHRKYTWIMLALILLGEGILFLICFENREHMIFFAAARVVGMVMVTGFFATLFTCDIVFAGQYQHGTLKNEVSFGLSRAKIYWGKFIAMTLLSIAVMIIALGLYLAVCRVMLPDYTPNAVYNEVFGVYEGGGALTALQLVGLAILTELPVWLGCQAIICAASFLLNSVLAANFGALGIVIGSYYAVGLIGMLVGIDSYAGKLLEKIFNYWLPYSILTAKSPGVAWLQERPTPAILEIDWGMIGRGWIIGAFWFILATVLGLYFFHKKEIK